jgi:hypothetical protein
MIRHLVNTCWCLGDSATGEHYETDEHYSTHGEAVAAATRLRLDLVPRAETYRCWVVICETCGVFGNPEHDTTEWHFTDVADCVESLGDWQTNTRGQPGVCPDCVLAEECDAHGHDYTGWRQCGCRGQIRRHVAAGCPEFRYCRRCHLPDYAYPAAAG